jgi:hypothetical protein
MTRGGRSIVVAGVAMLAVVAGWRPSRASSAPRFAWPGAPCRRSAGPAALARDVLASGLSLSAAQHRALVALATQWERESTALEAAVGAAAEEFDRFAASAKAAGRTSLAEVQQRSAELRELSAELRAHRQVQGDGALAVLTDAQRRQLQTTSGGTR